MANTKPITDEEFEAANRAGAARRVRGVAVSVRYFSTARRLAIELSTGATLTIPVDLVEGLAGQPDAALADVMLGSGGQGLCFRQIDADVSVAGLMDGVFGSPRWMAGERNKPEASRRGEPATPDVLRELARSAVPPRVTPDNQIDVVNSMLDAFDASLKRISDETIARGAISSSGVTVSGLYAGHVDSPIYQGDRSLYAFHPNLWSDRVEGIGLKGLLTLGPDGQLKPLGTTLPAPTRIGEQTPSGVRFAGGERFPDEKSDPKLAPQKSYGGSDKPKR